MTSTLTTTRSWPIVWNRLIRLVEFEADYLRDNLLYCYSYVLFSWPNQQISPTRSPLAVSVHWPRRRIFSVFLHPDKNSNWEDLDVETAAQLIHFISHNENFLGNSLLPKVGDVCGLLGFRRLLSHCHCCTACMPRKPILSTPIPFLFFLSFPWRTDSFAWHGTLWETGFPGPFLLCCAAHERHVYIQLRFLFVYLSSKNYK